MQKNNVDPTMSDLLTATPSDQTVQVVKKNLKDNAMQAQDVNEGTNSAITSSTRFDGLANAWWISLITIAFCVLIATVVHVVLLVKKKNYLRFNEEESQGHTNQTSNKTAVAIEMTSPGSLGNLGSGAKINESSIENQLQAVQVVQVIQKTKNKSFFDSAAAAPPEERISRSRGQIKKRSLPMPLISSAAAIAMKGVVVTTEMGNGILMYKRPKDQCRVFELEWKLAGDSKAILSSFKK